MAGCVQYRINDLGQKVGRHCFQAEPLATCTAQMARGETRRSKKEDEISLPSEDLRPGGPTVVSPLWLYSPWGRREDALAGAGLGRCAVAL